MNHRLILRDSALALAAFVAVGAWIGGASGALGTLVSGLLMMANSWVIAVVVQRFLRSVASGEGGGLVALAVFAKLPLTLGLFALTMWLFDPLSAALGLSSVVGALMIRSLLSVASTPTEPEPAPRSS